MTLRAPFPWFGGKSTVAADVWERIGDVACYVEPFAGSLAVLLARPHVTGYEIIGDADGYLANFWRATAFDFMAVLEHAWWPPNETDYNARLQEFKDRSAEVCAKAEADPNLFDARLAGLWLWGQSTAILGNWPKTRGVHIMRYGMHAMKHEELRDAMMAIRNRLYRTVVLCGDFERTLRGADTGRLHPCGVFLDPPYDPKLRDQSCYATDDAPAGRARAWALAHGDDPNVRIALCGYEGEHDMPSTWETFAWKAVGGMDRIKGVGRGKSNRNLERIWFSPHCLKSQQLSLLGAAR